MTYEHRTIQKQGPINRSGLWRVTTDKRIVHWFDWDRQRYACPPKSSSRKPPAEGDWLQMTYPMEFLEIGYPFRVFLDETRPRYANDVVKIELLKSARIPKPQVQDPVAPPTRAESTPKQPEPATADVPEPLWTIEQLATYLQVKVKTVYNWRVKRQGPAAVIIGGRPRWDRKEVERWLAGNSEGSSDKPR